MKSFWIIWVGPKYNDKCPIRDTQRKDAERRGEGHVKTEAEIGVMQPQAKESPEAGRGEDSFSPRAFKWGVALMTP